MIPVWLLDVDGVLNANKPGWSAAPHTQQIPFDNLSFRMRWAPALVKRIRDLHFGGTVEIRWCTTWCDYAHLLEAAFRLPEFPREPIPPSGITQQAKIDAAVRVVESMRPLIWTDDDAIPHVGEAGWNPLLSVGLRKLFIEPKPNRGLQPEDMDNIEGFIFASRVCR